MTVGSGGKSGSSGSLFCFADASGAELLGFLSAIACRKSNQFYTISFALSGHWHSHWHSPYFLTAKHPTGEYSDGIWSEVERRNPVGVMAHEMARRYTSSRRVLGGRASGFRAAQIL